LTTEVRWLWNKDTTMVRLKKNGPTTIKRIWSSYITVVYL
jgi:hypothetical protein